MKFKDVKYIIIGVIATPFVIAIAIMSMWIGYILIPILIAFFIAAMLKADSEMDEEEPRYKRRTKSSYHKEDQSHME